ncbi:MAG: Hsp20/alpha crystallin family protein [Rhodopila sp.]
MATTPVPVKQTTPVPSGAPDYWRSFKAEMDRLFDRFTGTLGIAPFQALRGESIFAMPIPAVDITEDDAAIRLTAEMPGMTEKDVQVSLSGNTLVIKGEKRQEREEKDKGYHLSERCYGEFQRSFLLPDGADSDKVEASFANGVLTVTVPKTAQAAPKKIEVKAAA